ncbi:hypothetical protein [Streptomyces diacarni]|uniref:hypothetical protein n=1 Tax=Streptomyces diacarni TaxID=2800381 RepID=UPI001FE737F4|nr:hypothetical protein [Streptomyces diacarni]
MKTSRREHPRNPTGAPPAHRVERTTHRRADGTAARRDDAYLDGLFTYCLSVLCEHEAALLALGETLVLADRQHARGRAPEAEHLRRPWLYALARWACSRRLAEQKAKGRAGARADGREGTPAGGGSAAAGRGVAHGGASVPASPAATGRELLDEAARVRQRSELAALAWPEAAGTSPAQREALELSVRHGLPPAQIAAVLAMPADAAEDLLMNAACEVERTRAALHVVESGGCAAVARLAGDDRLLMGSALRRELVRHVDECPQCRRAAERAMAGVSWPGTAPASAALAVVAAPRSAVYAAVELAHCARAQRAPRFDRAGFPVRERNRAARRERLRARVLTSTVVTAVVAAPVFAAWAAYRGGQDGGEPQAERSAAAPEQPRGSAGAPRPQREGTWGPRGRHAGGDGHHRRASEPGKRAGGAVGKHRRTGPGGVLPSAVGTTAGGRGYAPPPTSSAPGPPSSVPGVPAPGGIPGAPASPASPAPTPTPTETTPAPTPTPTETVSPSATPTEAGSPS